MIWFKKNKIQALIDSSNEVNAMILVYASKLRFQICQINVEAYKIDSSAPQTF